MFDNKMFTPAKEVTDDLNDMMAEVESLKRNSVIYDSNTELQDMIRVSERFLKV